jgi:hypothetical protein
MKTMNNTRSGGGGGFTGTRDKRKGRTSHGGLQLNAVSADEAQTT